MHFSTFQTLLWGSGSQPQHRSNTLTIQFRGWKGFEIVFSSRVCFYFVCLGAMFPSVSDIPIICCCKQIDVSGYRNNSQGTHQGWRPGSYLLFISNSLYPPHRYIDYLGWLSSKYWSRPSPQVIHLLLRNVLIQFRNLNWWSEGRLKSQLIPYIAVPESKIN